jgi:uncharacterized surface anchored protein
MKIFRSFVFPVILGLVLLSCSEDAANEPAAVSVSGIVQIAGTKVALPGADVTASRHDNSEVLGRTVTDSTGAFILQGLPPVVMDIIVEADGYAPVLFESMDPVNAPQSLGSMSVQMTALDSCCSGVLILYVKNASGEKLKNIPVAIKKDGVVIDDPRTNDNGRIAVDGLCPGDYSIRIAVEPYKVYEAVFTINALCEPVELIAQLQQENEGCCDGVFTLIVRDGNNNPVENAKVLIRKGSQVIEDPRTDANGKIIVDGLCAGEYNYRISKEGYKVVEGVFAINSSCDPVTKEAELEQEAQACCSGVLTVTATDPQNQPIAGAVVRLWRGGSQIASMQTNASGVAVFDSLCKGEYAVDVLKDGWTDREAGFAINESCDPVSKTFVMEQLPCCDGVFTLVVRDGSNNPVVGAKVLIRKGSKVIEDPRTDANGKIIVDGLCAGEYNFRIAKEGFKVVEGVFAINSSCDPVTKEVTLETESVCCTGVLTVTAVDSSATPIAGATVKLWKDGVVIEAAQTDAQGKAMFDGLCKGEYGVDVQKSGLKNREFVFAINVNCDPYAKTVELLP